MGFLKDRIWTWGYVLDKIPSAAPFTFEKTRCSLETEAAYLGAKRTFYNNSMFSREYIETNFPTWDKEILESCIDNRLSPMHMERLKNFEEVFCTLEHENYLESAIQAAKLSLQFPNITGVHFDDFGPSQGSEILERVHDAIKEINPKLKIAVVTYSHFDQEPYKKAVKYVDIFSRWRWVPSEDYWRRHKDDIKVLRDIVGPEKKILQGIYIHDFGSSGFHVSECMYKVPLELFKISVETICEHTFDGTLDGIIIPQAAYFGCLSHKENISFLKEHIDWFDGTTTVL